MPNVLANGTEAVALRSILSPWLALKDRAPDTESGQEIKLRI